MSFSRFSAFALALAATGWVGAAAADDLPPPSGDVVLIVSGAISNTNVGDTAQFDMEMLKDLGAASFTTSTIWTEGPQVFTGVTLESLMDTVGANADMIKATAINDYAVDIPRSDWIASGPIVAYEQNGAGMSLRDKGPLWMVYPYDANSDYQSEVIYSRSIWQLDRIVVTD